MLIPGTNGRLTDDLATIIIGDCDGDIEGTRSHEIVAHTKSKDSGCEVGGRWRRAITPIDCNGMGIQCTRIDKVTCDRDIVLEGGRRTWCDTVIDQSGQDRPNVYPRSPRLGPRLGMLAYCWHLHSQ